MMQEVARGRGDGGGLGWAHKQRPAQTKMFSVDVGDPAFPFAKYRCRWNMPDCALITKDH